MGLDVTAYRSLVPTTESATTVSFAVYWEGRAEDIVPNAHYSFAEEFVFRGGSYSGYGVWRQQLADLAGDEDRLAFHELVDFSDCEGTIGTAVSAKLAADFARYQPKADAHPDDYFRRKYADWRRAFEMAADGGAVAFH